MRKRWMPHVSLAYSLRHPSNNIARITLARVTCHHIRNTEPWLPFHQFVTCFSLQKCYFCNSASSIFSQQFVVPKYWPFLDKCIYMLQMFQGNMIWCEIESWSLMCKSYCDVDACANQCHHHSTGLPCKYSTVNIRFTFLDVAPMHCRITCYNSCHYNSILRRHTMALLRWWGMLSNNGKHNHQHRYWDCKYAVSGW